MAGGWEMTLDVLNDAKLLCKMIYIIARKLPDDERFGLSSQIKRAVVSIASNLAEGNDGYGKDRQHFFVMAHTSLKEVQVQLELMRDLFNIDIKESWLLADKVGARTYKLISALRNQPPATGENHDGNK